MHCCPIVAVFLIQTKRQIWVPEPIVAPSSTSADGWMYTLLVITDPFDTDCDSDTDAEFN